MSISIFSTMAALPLSAKALYAAHAATLAAEDTIILNSGDLLTGTFIRATDAKVTFKNEITGELRIDWNEIKEIKTASKVSVVPRGVTPNRKSPSSEIKSGRLKVDGNQVTLINTDGSEIAQMLTSQVKYIVDETTLDKELRREPGLFQAWNGAVSAGAALVRAAQNAYNIDGAVSLVRSVPTGSWLAPRNRTSLLLSGASGRITQPAYTSIAGAPVDAQITKTNIYHFSAKRDQYFQDHLYYFGVVELDHNYSQNLQLQQLYGAGLGWTSIQTATQLLDLTVNIQYVKQNFINSQQGDNKNLVGSTISANYIAQLANDVTFRQYAAFLPAFNNGDAYSIVQRNTLTLPAYGNFRMMLGTTNSYLNLVARSDPPAKRNSFQFTLGLSYDINSSY